MGVSKNVKIVRLSLQKKMLRGTESNALKIQVYKRNPSALAGGFLSAMFALLFYRCSGSLYFTL